MTPVSTNVPNRLGRILLERTLTQDELAQRAGVHPKTIDRLIKSGQDVRISTALAVARALGVSVAAIWQPEVGHD
jgi:DNA-binding XRE family transcriptional regulator